MAVSELCFDDLTDTSDSLFPIDGLFQGRADYGSRHATGGGMIRYQNNRIQAEDIFISIVQNPFSSLEQKAEVIPVLYLRV